MGHTHTNTQSGFISSLQHVIKFIHSDMLLWCLQSQLSLCLSFYLMAKCVTKTLENTVFPLQLICSSVFSLPFISLGPISPNRFIEGWLLMADIGYFISFIPIKFTSATLTCQQRHSNTHWETNMQCEIMERLKRLSRDKKLFKQELYCFSVCAMLNAQLCCLKNIQDHQKTRERPDRVFSLSQE